MDTKVGFIGLGRMGRGMAENMLRAGVDLIVFDVRPDAFPAMEELGAKIADSVAHLAAQADVIFTSLPGPAEVSTVMRGPDGIIENIRGGAVVFDLTTSSLGLAKELAVEFADRGATFFDAPVSGMPDGAASGDLAIWAGGPADVFTQVLPVLRTFSSMPQRVGDTGAGTVTKLANNILGYMILEALGEAFSMATKGGIDPLELWKALKTGGVERRTPLDMLVAQFLPGKFDSPAFALKLAHKDVTLAAALARELGVPMRMANLTHAELTEALGRGYGDQDSRIFLTLQLERAGVEIAVDPERLEQAVAERRQR